MAEPYQAGGFYHKNVLGIQTEEWYTDMYGEEYAIAYDKDTISMLDFLGLGGGEEDFIRLGNVPEEFEAFTRIFSDQYDMMKESLIDADGNQMSMEDYLGQIAEYGEFNNTMDKPLEKFAENLLDILIIPPIIF